VGSEPVWTLWRKQHLAPAGYPTPAVQPVARRDATDTGVIRMECIPLHIYVSSKHRYNSTKLHGVTIRKIVLFMYVTIAPAQFLVMLVIILTS
jgi:hypothetical protein